MNSFFVGYLSGNGKATGQNSPLNCNLIGGRAAPAFLVTKDQLMNIQITDLIITSYQLDGPGDVQASLCRFKQRDGSVLWGIQALDTLADLAFEAGEYFWLAAQSPCHKDNADFHKLARWSTPEEALTDWLDYLRNKA